MSETATETASARFAPWHIWLVGILAVLWNGAGAYTIFAAQAGTLAGASADEAAYYAAQQGWFVALTDVALVAAILAGFALLLRSRWAVTLFAISLAAIVVTNGYDLAMGTSRMTTSTATILVTLTIWVLAVLQLWYAMTMRTRGMLR